MSTDFIAVCDVCRIKIHMGQRQGVSQTLAYGGKDWPEKAQSVLTFIFTHTYCDATKGVRVLVADTIEDRECDNYRWWNYDEGEEFERPASRRLL